MQSRLEVRSSPWARIARAKNVLANTRKRRPLAIYAVEADAIDASALAGILGYISGAGFFSLWFIEQKAKANIESELQLAKSKADDQAALLAKLNQELERERDATKDLAMYKRRLDEATKDNLKLERALELKDGSFEAFTVVAQRQIKYLEDTIKELQKNPQ